MRAQIRDRDLEDLETERDFLLRSLMDLDEEHSAGDVSDEDYTRLHDTYTARAAEVLRSITVAERAQRTLASARDSQDPRDARDSRDARRVHDSIDGRVAGDQSDQSHEPDHRDGSVRSGTKPTSRRRGLLIGGVVSVLAGIAIAVVVSNTGARLPGNTATGSGPSLSTQQTEARELAQAEELEVEGQYEEALLLFQKVVAQDPVNAIALSESGWLEFEAGVLGGSKGSLQRGQSTEERAVTVDPGLPAAHGYLGTMFFLESNPAQAVAQYSQFVADGPTAAELNPFLPDIKKAFAEAKKSLPPLTTATS